MLSLRTAGLVLSACLSISIQQPVLPADLADGANDHAPSQALAVSRPADSIIFDENEGVWKRWKTEIQPGSAKSIIRLATSADGKTWIDQGQACFEPSTDATAWDGLSVSNPAVAYDRSAPSDQRFILLYTGTSAPKGSNPKVTISKIGMATSSDGRKFTRLAADQSKLNAAGLVVDNTQAFSNNPDVKDCAIGVLGLASKDSDLQLSYYKVGFDGAGNVITAAMAEANSEDGITWQTEESGPFQINVVGKSASAPAMIERLRHLSAACTQESM